MRGADEQPIFVIGNPRSGTTLLRLMLTSHPRICIPPEAGFAVWLLDRYRDWDPSDGTEGFLGDLVGTRKFATWGLTRGEIAAFVDRAEPEDYGGLVAAVYRCYAHRVQPGSDLWGDKNNFHIGEVGRIKGLFPGVRFVHIVRDGRNVAASYRDLAGRTIRSEYAPDLPTGIEAIAEGWSAALEGAEAAFAGFGHEDVATIRLEDLQADPEAVLTEVCAGIGVEFDPEMLRYHELDEASGGEPAEYLQWKEKNRAPVLAPDPGRYRRDLTPGEIARFEEIAGDRLRRYGYPL
jgi:hypothetical protein